MGVKGIPTPYAAPNANANAFVERFALTLRREALGHFVFLSEQHVRRVVRELRDAPARSGRVVALPVLGGVQHDYRRAA
jgi:hypothetical protein